MNRTFLSRLALGLATTLGCAASPVTHASQAQNGTSFNGLSLNGLSLNGVSIHGARRSRTAAALNGVRLQGARVSLRRAR